jgi:PIN domain nuclease of toxin-antitoxin system
MLLVDTNALIWAEIADPRLGPIAAQWLVSAARSRQAFICPISFWEVQLAIDRRRLILAKPVETWRADLLAAGYHERPISGSDTILMAKLANFHADPADRLIVAVAINAGFELLTSEQKILDWTGDLPRLDARR